jgi:hypothetical protein
MLQRNDKLTRGPLPQDFAERTICFPHDGARRTMRVQCASSMQKFCAGSTFVMPAKAGIQ